MFVEMQIIDSWPLCVSMSRILVFVLYYADMQLTTKSLDHQPFPFSNNVLLILTWRIHFSVKTFANGLEISHCRWCQKKKKKTPSRNDHVSTVHLLKTIAFHNFSTHSNCRSFLVIAVHRFRPNPFARNSKGHHRSGKQG